MVHGPLVKLYLRTACAYLSGKPFVKMQGAERLLDPLGDLDGRLYGPRLYKTYHGRRSQGRRPERNISYSICVHEGSGQYLDRGSRCGLCCSSAYFLETGKQGGCRIAAKRLNRVRKKMKKRTGQESDQSGKKICISCGTGAVKQSISFVMGCRKESFPACRACRFI